MKTIKSYLPVFNGFYNTWFDSDNAEDSVFEENDLNYENVEFDYEDYMNRVAEACVGAVENQLKDLFNINIKYEGINSPKEYNFTNDSINVEYTLDTLDEIFWYLKEYKTEFEEHLKERYTSRSGFSSFWSNKYDVWVNEYLNDEESLEHCLGSVLDFILSNEGYTDEDLYYNVIGETSYINYEIKSEI